MEPQQAPAGAGTRRWIRSARVQDAALALAVIVPEAFFFGAPIAPGTRWPAHLVLAAFALPEAVALLFRRRWPMAVYLTVWALAVGASVLTILTDFHFTPYFGILVALYTVARQCRRPAALTALAVTAVPVGLDTADILTSLGSPGYRTAALVTALAFYLPLTIAAWGVGRWSRATAAAADHDRLALARARLAVTHERVRIARELHDIVANAVAVIVMQAETARATAAADPPRAEETLGRIEDLGRGAMAELRRLLRLLRTADASVEDGVRRRGLADLAPLLEDVRRAGVLIDLEVHGSPAHLDESVDLTAYRLVQEAVTNITKHAGPGSHAEVRITWADVLRLDVVDDGAGHLTATRRDLSTGHGLIGLAERIALFGGELSATPYRSGFRVTATLPLAPGAVAAERAG
ncbi:histidine kinase [Streptomyces sp. SP17BM10]|uniref:sensor histidine kinase n=1 Tax=Streptomyces sp. SP17BM10 TaxID=3002530 RepID=UPI002E771402|nr:histidine kinase [Streptomyces sp. SP17BM10]MEE1788446.1 histidine kinase [Streptomyces sp. SP17BM10]